MPADLAATLDQYYTKPAVAQMCLDDLLRHLKRWKLTAWTGLEPSAGGGAFLDAFKTVFGSNQPYVASDLDPAPGRKDIHKRDFLVEGVQDLLPKSTTVITIGNPPFGRKSTLAAAFINEGLQLGPVVAFIVPIQFHKWSAQRLVRESAKLIEDRALDADSFVFMGRDYKVRCCFQIWVRGDFPPAHKDLDIRLQHKPHTDHGDFDAWQYNRTDLALKYFDYVWDFAVPRQGYQDYTFKATNAAQCDRKKQWIFFKAHSPAALARLKAIDFVALSHKNTGLPGFGKADVVAAYEALIPAERGT